VHESIGGLDRRETLIGESVIGLEIFSVVLNVVRFVVKELVQFCEP